MTEGSIELELVNKMVELITSFAINGIPTVENQIWNPLNENDVIPNVLNIDNTGTSIIPLPEFEKFKVFEEIFKEAEVDLI